MRNFFQTSLGTVVKLIIFNF